MFFARRLERRQRATLFLADYPLQTHDKLGDSDTDRQGHVNNAVFSSFLETGRAELLYDPAFGVRGWQNGGASR